MPYYCSIVAFGHAVLYWKGYLNTCKTLHQWIHLYKYRRRKPKGTLDEYSQFQLTPVYDHLAIILLGQFKPEAFFFFRWSLPMNFKVRKQDVFVGVGKRARVREKDQLQLDT